MIGSKYTTEGLQTLFGDFARMFSFAYAPPTDGRCGCRGFLGSPPPATVHFDEYLVECQVCGSTWGSF